MEVKEGLVDTNIIKTAFNANFERTCIASYFKILTPPEQWSCTLVMALELGLPMSFEEIGKFLNLKNQKLEEGKSLIKYFSVPCKGAKSNDFRNRNLPKDDKEKWEQFKAYCIKDVEVQREIRKRLFKCSHGKSEEKLWWLDQKINDRGVKVDTILINHALNCDEGNKEKLLKEATILTGLNYQKCLRDILSSYCKYKNKTYEMPDPFGGDDKNDGWVVEDATFYQVYAPTRLKESFKKEMQEKFSEDLEGLIKKVYVENKWNGRIDTFIFIVNTLNKSSVIGPVKFLIVYIFDKCDIFKKE